MVNNSLGGLKFGVDSDGNYGYIKVGADTVTPFSNGEIYFPTMRLGITGGETLYIVLDVQGCSQITIDNVSINANSVVIGKITIGDNVVVGAGSVVTKSVPDNCVVVGNPAFILKENGITVKRPL